MEDGGVVRGRVLVVPVGFHGHARHGRVVQLGLPRVARARGRDLPEVSAQRRGEHQAEHHAPAEVEGDPGSVVAVHEVLRDVPAVLGVSLFGVVERRVHLGRGRGRSAGGGARRGHVRYDARTRLRRLRASGAGEASGGDGSERDGARGGGVGEHARNVT